MKFKPGDKVIVRDYNGYEWIPAIYDAYISNIGGHEHYEHRVKLSSGQIELYAQCKLQEDVDSSEEFKYGDIVEVKYRNENIWHRAKFIAYDKDADGKKYFKFIARMMPTNTSVLFSPTAYSQCRKYVEPKPDLTMDTPVWVSLDNKQWAKRHFKCWDNIDSEGMIVWNNGFTSHTGDGYCSYFKYWSLTDPKGK